MTRIRTEFMNTSSPAQTSLCRLLAGLLLFVASLCAVTSIAAKDQSDTQLPQRKSFVPVEDLDVVLSRDREGVLLSRDEFQKLYQKARTNQETAPALPDGIVISNADYSAKIVGDHLLVRAEIQIQQFHPGWTNVVLPFGQMSVEAASVNGEPAKLGRNTASPKGKQKPVSVLTLLHNQVGRSTLELELSTLLHASGNDRTAVFQLIPVPSATLKVDVPAGRHLTVGSHSLKRPTPVDQPATFSVPVGRALPDGGSTSIRLLFNDHQNEQKADSLAFASTGYGVHVVPGEVTWQAKTSLQVFGTTYNQIFCSVPASLEITGVESTGLESWELSDDPDATESTLITLNYRQPFDGSRDLIFRGVMATETGRTWAVPNLTLRSVTSHIGRVTVQHPAGVRVRLVDSEGARAATGTAGEQTFDVWREDFNLAFETRTRERELHATVTSMLDLAPTGVTFSGATQVASHFAPLFDVTFRLPAEWRVELVEVDGDSLPWQVSSREAGWNSYHIALSSPLPPGKELSFRFMSTQELDDWPVEEEAVEFTFPAVQIPEASLVEGTFVIRAGDDLELKTVDLFNLDPAPSTAANERLRYFFQQADYEGQLTVSRKASRVSAQSLTFTRLEREVLQSHLQTTLNITGGGLRTLTVGLSESAGENLQFQLTGSNARIVEQLPGEVENGLRNWTLNLDQRVTGQMTLSVDVSTPRNDSADYDVHRMVVPVAERMSGYVAVEGAPDQQIEVLTNSASNVPLQTVDPIDVPTPLLYSPQERIVGAYRFNVPGYSVAISETRFDRVAVPSAVCYSSQLRTVIGRTGEMQHRAEVQFVAVGAQGLQVRLPDSADGLPESELWSTLIDGQPIEVRSSLGVYLVPIPADGAPDQQHQLVLFYRTYGPTLAESSRIRQVPPQISVIHSEGAEQRLETLRQRWTLHYPNGTMLTSSNGDFTPSRTLDSVSLLGSLQEQFTQIDRASLMRNGLVAGVLLIFVGAIALSLRRLGVGLVGCAGATIAGVVMLAWLSTTFIAEPQLDSKAGYEMATRESARRNIDDLAVLGESAEFSLESDAEIMDGVQPGHAFGFQAPEGMSSDGGEVDFVREVAPRDAPAGITDRRAEPTSRMLRSPQQAATPPVATAQPQAPSAAPADRFAGQKTGSLPRVTSEPSNQSDAERPTRQMFEKEELFWSKLDGQQLAAQFGRDDAPIDGRNNGVANGRGLGRTSSLGRSMSGLLSLSMNLQVPRDSQSIEFQYSGNRTAESGVGIDVVWQDRDSMDLGRVFLMTAVALFFWLMLGLSVRVRAILAVMGIAVPLSLISVAPAGTHIILDGVFLGSVVAVGLWFLRAVCSGLKALFARRFRTGRTHQGGIAAMVLLATIVGGDVSVEAAEPAPPQNSERQVVPQAPPVPPFPASKSVIVPYEAGTSAEKAERVLLTREQFLKLWNLAHPDQQVDGPAPVKGLIDAAFYECRLNRFDEQNASVEVAATFVLHSFREGQVALTVPLGSVALSESLLDGKPASLVSRQDKSGQHIDVIVRGKGRHTLDLKFAVPAQVAGSVGQFTLPLKAVPSGRVVFRLPDEGLDVRVNGSTNAYRRASDDGGPTIEVPVGDGNPLTIAWRPPEQQGMVASIVHVESATAVLIDDVGVSEISRVSIRVPQGTISDLSFDLPGELRLRQITGPQLAGWELNEVDGDRQLKVFFNPAVTSETSLDLKLYLDEKPFEDEQVLNLPVVAPRDVTRDTGLVAVLAAETYRVRSGTVTGLSQIAANQKLPLPVVESPAGTSVRLAWRYASRPFSLEVITGRQTPRSEVTVQHAIQVSRRKVHLASLMKASLRGAPRPGLTFELPEELLLLSVDATSMSDWYVSESDGANPRTLTIEFEEPRLGDVEVVMESQLTKFPNDLIVEVAPPFPLEIGRPTSYAGVWFDDAYSATPLDSFGWEAVDPQRVPVELRQRNTRPLRYAFRSTADAAEVIGFEVGRARARLVADAVVMTSVADTFLDYSLALNWQISDAAVDQFTFTTPLWLKDRLSFAGGSIRDVVSTVEGEKAIWTLHLQDAVKNRYFVLATATLPPATRTVDTPSIGFLKPQFDEFGDPVGFLPLETQRQYVLLINQSQAQLSSRHDSSIEPVSASEIPINVDQSLLDQAAELLRIRDSSKLPSWTVRRLEQQAGAPASVNVADLTLSIAADGTWRGQAVYTVRNRRRQFLGVRLPLGSRLLSLFVKGQPSRPVMTELDGQPVHLVPLPKASDSDVSFQVKLVFSGAFKSSLPDGLTFRASDLDVPAPQVVTPNESTEFGIGVARTLWKVHLPKGVDYQIVETPDRTNVTRASDIDSQKAYVKSQLSDLSEMLTIVSGKGYTRKSRIAASNNSKQLGLALQNYREGALSGSDGETVELQQRIAKLEEQLSENREQIEEYANAPALRSDVADFDGDGVISFSDQGEAAQRSQVTFNNGLLLGGNYAGSGSGPFTTSSSGLPAARPGSGPAPETDFGVPNSQDKASTTDSKQLNRFTLSIKGEQKPQTRTAAKKSSEQQVDKLSAGTRVMRRQQSLSNVERLNDFVDSNNGNMPAEPNASDMSQSVAGGMFGGGGLGGGGMAGTGSVTRRHDVSGPNTAPEDFSGDRNGRIQQQQLAQAEPLVRSRSKLKDQGFETAAGDSETPEWTKVGGLSLPVDIPVAEQSLSFSRVGGEPKLALKIRSRELIDTGVGLVWSLVWLGIALTLIVAFSRVSTARELVHPLVWVLFFGGMLSFLILPGAFSGLGFVAFLLGLLALASRFVRSRRMVS